MKGIWGVIVLLGIVSCKHASKVPGNEEVITWEVAESLGVSVYIDSIEYLPLETHPDGVFTTIDKMIVRDDKIYIHDRRNVDRVLVFDTLGNFLFPVGHKGRGHGEFQGCRNFAVDDDYIYVINDWRSELLLFDQEGRYVETKKMPRAAHDMVILDNGDYLFGYQQLEGANNVWEHKIFVTDKDMNVKTCLLPVNQSDCSNFSRITFFTQWDNNIAFNVPLSDTIYLLPSDRVTNMSKIRFDFQSRAIPLKSRKDYSRVLDSQVYIEETPFVTSRYIIGEGFNGAYIIDRASGRVVENTMGEDSTFIMGVSYVKDNTVYYYIFNGLYENCVNEGMQRAPREIEEKLADGDCVIIKYILK